MGETGATGPQGISGEAAAMGATGSTGIRGEDGPAGIAGDKGDRGDRGIQGPSGPSGFPGPAPDDLPSEPVNISAVLIDKGIIVSWSAPESAISMQICSYKVELLNNYTRALIQSASISSCYFSYTFSNILPIVNTFPPNGYRIRVRSINAIGESLNFAELTDVQPFFSPAPPTVTSVTKNKMSQCRGNAQNESPSVKITWTEDSLISDDPGWRTDAKIWKAGDPEPSNDNPMATGLGLDYTPSLQGGLYNLRLRSYNAGLSAKTDYSSILPFTACDIPNPPTSVQATNMGGGKAPYVQISWAKGEEVAGCEVKRYSVYTDAVDGGNYYLSQYGMGVTVLYTGTSTSISTQFFNNAARGNDTSFRAFITAWNDVGESCYATVIITIEKDVVYCGGFFNTIDACDESNNGPVVIAGSTTITSDRGQSSTSVGINVSPTKGSSNSTITATSSKGDVSLFSDATTGGKVRGTTSTGSFSLNEGLHTQFGDKFVDLTVNELYFGNTDSFARIRPDSITINKKIYRPYSLTVCDAQNHIKTIQVLACDPDAP
jgi:hypothetical protein